jgi:cobalamin biosynthesis Mg chelatase CobN
MYQSVPTTANYMSTSETFPSIFPSPSSNQRQSTNPVTTTLSTETFLSTFASPSSNQRQSINPVTTTLTRSSKSTDEENISSKHTNKSPSSPITSTTGNPKEGLREETSESGGGNSAAIAITVTLLLVALAVALGFLVYYRRRKR